MEVIYHSFRIFVIPSILLSFLPYYCHSFRIIVIPTELLPFHIFFIQRDKKMATRQPKNTKKTFFVCFWAYVTQPVWTLFLFKSIWMCSQGSQGCQKSDFFLQIKLLSSCAKIEPGLRKLQKTVKIETKSSKNHVCL